MIYRYSCLLATCQVRTVLVLRVRRNESYSYCTPSTPVQCSSIYLYILVCIHTTPYMLITYEYLYFYSTTLDSVLCVWNLGTTYSTVDSSTTIHVGSHYLVRHPTTSVQYYFTIRFWCQDDLSVRFAFWHYHGTHPQWVVNSRYKYRYFE
jgi:hypothetical protein